jgi:hypothetical protein
MMRKTAIALALLILTSTTRGSGVCAAGDDEEWYPDSAGPMNTWTAPVMGKGELLAQPFFIFTHTRGVFNTEGNYNSLPAGEKRSSFQQQLYLEYGITDRFEVSAQTGTQENYAEQAGAKAHTNGMTDSYFFLRYSLLEEKTCLPQITGVFQLALPTGKFQKADPNKLGTDIMGYGSYDHGYGLILTKRIKPFIVHADVIYNFSRETKIDGLKTRYADYINYDIGVEYFLPKGFNLLVELNGFLEGDIKEDGYKIPSSDYNYLDACFGIGWSNEKIQTLLAYERTLTGTNADANDSAIFTVIYNF